MADEPRRSGRATKGVHTKNADIDSPAPAKRKGKGQPKASKQTPTEPTPPATEEDEIIRCVCGEYEEEEDVERDMICCDQCSAWQHNDCMGLTFPKGDEPAEYYCERCKPENHKDLLEKMARGEKPWEEAARIRAQQAQEKKPRKKKGGKRGRKPRASEAKSEMSEAPSGSAAPTPTRDGSFSGHRQDHHGAPAGTEPTSAQKRKFDAQGENEFKEPEPKQKLQRVSTGPSPPHQPEVRRSPVQERKPSVAMSPSTQTHKTSMSPVQSAGGTEENLTVARKNAVNALTKILVAQVAAAQKEGTFTLSPGQTKDSFGGSLASAVEQSMYNRLCNGSGEPNEAYKQQLRTILFNVRKNPSLRDNLLVGSTSPDAISTMSTHDMASKELRQKEDEIKREAERQHIIVQETGPRIRRTHKGEEIVESDPHLVGTESIFSSAPARRDTRTGSQGHASMSPRGASPPVTQRAEYNEFSDAASRAQLPHPIDTNVSQDGGSRRTSSANFNIQDVWSSLHSPETGAHHNQVFGQAYSEQPVPAGNKVQADAEIDQLLKDDEAESPPYSPKDFHADGAVWQGKVVMNSITEFSASARHVGGADLSGRIPWSHMVPNTIQIDGRIETQLATNYVCGLRYSQTTDITVIAIAPPDAPDGALQFNRLFDYFVERNRYGVVGEHPHQHVKDTYLVPVEAGASKKPEFIELLENNSVGDPTPERLLLVVFVVKSGNPSNPPSTQHTPRDVHQTATGSSLGASPSTTPHSQAPVPSAHSASATGSNQSPQAPQSPYVPPPAQIPQLPPDQEPTGAAAASHFLGTFITAPAIQQLLQHAPNATASQFRLVAGILADNPAAADDYQVLMNAIAEAQNGAQAT